MKFHTQTPAPLLAMIKSDEGFRSRVYTDTRGYQTIGIGFCLDMAPMPERVAEYWASYLLDNLDSRLRTNPSVGRTYQALNEPRQWAILNMAYQMGLTGVGKFRKMWKALTGGNYRQAADEALDSLWAAQTPKRARRVAEILRSGTLDVYRDRTYPQGCGLEVN